MVRVEFHERDDKTTLKIEGRLVGHVATDVRSAVASKQTPGKLIVDLSDLTWVDIKGEELLLWLARIGCSFVTGNAYSSFLSEKLSLRGFRQAPQELG